MCCDAWSDPKIRIVKLQLDTEELIVAVQVFHMSSRPHGQNLMAHHTDKLIFCQLLKSKIKCLSACMQVKMSDNRSDVIDYFDFYPSKAMSIVALTLFAIAGLAVLAVTVKTRQWYMCIAGIVGLMEMAGFACRIQMLHKTVYGAYVAMQCLLIIPPSFLALVQYITLGKVIILVKQRYPERKMFLRPKWVIWGFFAMEIIALACQGAGAGLSVSDKGVDSTLKSGRILLIIGLVALVVLIGCYAITAVVVHSSPRYGVRHSPNLRRLFPVLYTCTALLMIRNIFRLVEFGQGFEGAIADQEKYFYGFDSLMIILILMINTIFHFGFFLKAYPSELKVQEPRAAVELA